MVTILVVDDSEMVRGQVKAALTWPGFAVVEAKDGVDALAQLAATPAIGLVICDVNMPRMGGLDFLDALHRSETRIPVVMLTTEGQSELMKRAKALGAKGWIVKPFVPDHLMAVARRLTAPTAPPPA